MKPLDGVRVLDLTRLLPGAVATMMLGDFGAEVIKIEQPGIGDPARTMSAGRNPAGTVFLATNRNKRSVAINLKRETGRELFMDLAAQTDVVVEGFRPGVMDRLGIGYETLRQHNPRLIYCAISGYGQDGPYRAHAGHDINYIGAAGVLALNGESDATPVIPGVQIADLAGGSLQAVIGILLALAARERNGEGQMVDVSMTDGALGMMIVPLAGLLASGIEPRRGDEMLTGRYACYHIYETKDGRFLSLGALESKFWANVCRVLGREELIVEQYAEGERQAACIATLTEVFRSRSAAEWLAAFEGVDSCLALVKETREVIEDAQITHRRLIIEIDHPTEGKLKQLAPFVRLSETPGSVDLPPPRLAEHTRQIVASLGYSHDAIEEMAREGVIGV